MTEKEFYIWLGTKIRDLREKSGLKQKEVAEKVGISAQYLSRIEYGQKVSVYQMDQILHALGKTLADIMDFTVETVPATFERAA